MPKPKRASRPRSSRRSGSVIRTDRDVNVTKIERLLTGAARDLRQMNSSLGLYMRDPGRYRPQLDNLDVAATSMRSLMSVLLRELGATDV